MTTAHPTMKWDRRRGRYVYVQSPEAKKLKSLVIDPERLRRKGTAEHLRRAAEKLEQRRKPKKAPDMPSWNAAECRAESARIQTEIDQLRAEIQERGNKISALNDKLKAIDICEWQHVWASPDALRFFAELSEAERLRIIEERRREEEKKANWFGAIFGDAFGTRPQQWAFSALGVPPTATGEQITQRYRELSRRFHPDANGGNADGVDRFIQITAAMDHLRAAGRVAR